MLASLNHPNIAAIYGVEDRALVLELVEGDAPAGPLSAEDALPPGPDLLGVCPAGMADCDGDPKNGCEAPLNTAWNCGACGSVCKLFGVAVYACIAGTCEVNRCNVGFGNCDGDSKNGCEVNTNLSHDNCGGCGIKCQKFQQCTRIGCE